MRLVARFRFRKRPLLVVDDPDTDARPGAARLRRDSPEEERRIRFRLRAGVFLLVSVCGAGCVAAVIGEGGLLDLMRVNREIAVLEAEIRDRRQAVAALEQAIRELEQGTLARERLAREQLGLMQPEEIGFLLPREEQPAWAAAPAQRGAGD